MSEVSFGNGTVGFEGRMGRVEFGGGTGTMRRINIPIPNAELGAFLKGPEMEANIRLLTGKVAAAYIREAPESEFDERVPGSGERNLKRGIGWDVNQGGGQDHDRIYGYVYNDALSYRKTRLQPYPRKVEYGKPTKGIPGGHHLQRAADLVAGGPRIVQYAPGISYEEKGRGSKLRGGRGRFVTDPNAPKKPKTVARASAKKSSRRKKK